MKVFDFDNTLYRGESSVDFSFYMIQHNKKILRYVPTILFSLVGYKLCLLKKEKIESIINDFFAGVLDGTESLSAFVNQFWEAHAVKLNKDLLRLIGPGDVIISASPEFLLEGIREMLNTEKIIGTEVDLGRKKITWFNFGDNKVKRYRELYGERQIKAFYTDASVCARSRSRIPSFRFTTVPSRGAHSCFPSGCPIISGETSRATHLPAVQH